MSIFHTIDADCKGRGFYIEDDGCRVKIWNGNACPLIVEKRSLFTDVCEAGSSVICDGSDEDKDRLDVYDLSNYKFGGSLTGLSVSGFGFDTKEGLIFHINGIVGRDIRNFCSCTPERTEVFPEGQAPELKSRGCTPIFCQAPIESDEAPEGVDPYPIQEFFVDTSNGRIILPSECGEDDEVFVQCLNDYLKAIGDPGKALYKPDEYPDQDIVIIGSCVRFFSYGQTTTLLFGEC